MLSQAQKDFVANLFGISAEELATGIASETEATFEIPKGKLYSETDIQTLTDNSSKEGYDRGATASREMVLKDLSKKAGLENNAKDVDSFIDNYKAGILKDLDTEPNDKIAELNNTIDELRGKIGEKDEAYNLLQNKIAQEQRNNTLKSFIPELSDKIGLSKDEALNLFLNQYEITEDGVKLNGDILYDELRNPITQEKAVESWVAEKGWNTIEEPKGKGRLDSNHGKGGLTTPKTFEDFETALQERGITEGSMEANALFAEMAKENPEILED